MKDQKQSRRVLATQSQPSRKQHALSMAASHQTSAAIPMTNHIPRTESELLLCEDEAFAEFRDNRMYHRIVSGISRRQEHSIDRKVKSLDYLYETSETIANIERTRHIHPDSAESLHSRHKKAWKSISGGEASMEESPKRANAREVITEAKAFLGPTFPLLDVADEDDQIFPFDP